MQILSNYFCASDASLFEVNCKCYHLCIICPDLQTIPFERESNVNSLWMNLREIYMLTQCYKYPGDLMATHVCYPPISQMSHGHTQSLCSTLIYRPSSSLILYQTTSMYRYCTHMMKCLHLNAQIYTPTCTCNVSLSSKIVSHINLQNVMGILKRSEINCINHAMYSPTSVIRQCWDQPHRSG